MKYNIVKNMKKLLKQTLIQQTKFGIKHTIKH